MKTKFWLTVNDRGTVRTTMQMPRKRIEEVSVYMELDLPDALFNRPRLTAQIKVSEQAVQPTEINVEVLENLEEAIKTTTGLDMKVSIVSPEEENDEGS